MRSIWLILQVLTLSSCTLLAAAAPTVSFKEGKGALEIFVDELCVAVYVWEDKDIPRPYLRSVKAPNGLQVTRNYPPDPVIDKRNDDHSTYHPGVWLAFGDINKADFWRNKARVRHIRFTTAPKGGKSRGSFSVLNVYESGRGESKKIICEELCTYTLYVTQHGTLITCQSTFGSQDKAFAFGDQEEMGLGVRFATGLTVRHGKGYILNSKDGVNEKGTWGRQAKWCAGFNTAGGAYNGMMVIPNPANFRPSWFHSRDYGLIVANPFGKKAMTAPKDRSVAPDRTLVKPGETLELGFGVYIFSLPEGDGPDLNPLYADYLKRVVKSR